MLKKISTKIRFDKEMAKKIGERFLLTTKLYNIAKDAAILVPKNHNLEGKSAIQMEGTAVKTKDNMTTKQIATQKIHANKLHAKLGHPGEDRIRATTKHLYYSIKDTLEVCECCAKAKSNHKLLHKVEEERDLQQGKIFYLDISSQK